MKTTHLLIWLTFSLGAAALAAEPAGTPAPDARPKAAARKKAQPNAGAGGKSTKAAVGKPESADPALTIATRSFSLAFEVGEGGRLYQRRLGARNEKTKRYDEAYPQAGDGYVWEPALQVVHADGNTSTALVYDSVTRTNESATRERVCFKLHDPAYPLTVWLCFRAHRDQDVIEQWTEIRHQEAKPVVLERMASTSLLLAPGPVHLTQFHGDWADEMKPVTELLTPGTKILDSKLGVRAHKFCHPSFVLGLDGPAAENSGRVLGGSLAWSGNFQCAFDHFGNGLRVLCGVNPFASAYHLNPGETFVTPTMIWAWSDAGIGGMSRKLHAWARDFGFREGHQPRQVLLNNWEATRFDFDFDRIAGLYEPARQMGVELFLLDDGWFGNKHPRVNAKAGLGDWEPNRQRLPNGIAPLAQAAIDHHLRFGIWIEPEMVNPSSVLFEQHPDWVIRQPNRELELQRTQLTLDLTRPAVQEFEWQVIQSVFDVPGVSYIKWDCNRYLTQPGSSWLAPDRQSHLWIDYVRALYQLMDRTMKRYPQTELMLCSGGGGRVDYGALKLLPRVLAQRQHRPGAARHHAMGLFLFLPGHDVVQPRYADGQTADAFRLHGGHERALRHGPGPGKAAAPKTRRFAPERSAPINGCARSSTSGNCTGWSGRTTLLVEGSISCRRIKRGRRCSCSS